MKRLSPHLVLLGLIALAFAPAAPAVFAEDEHAAEFGKLSISGVVEVDQEDGHGTVLAVGIDDEAHGYHVIATSGRGAELLALVGENVRVTGTLVEDSEGYLVLVVESFEKLAPSE